MNGRVGWSNRLWLRATIGSLLRDKTIAESLQLSWRQPHIAELDPFLPGLRRGQGPIDYRDVRAIIDSSPGGRPGEKANQCTRATESGGNFTVLECASRQEELLGSIFVVGLA